MSFSSKSFILIGIIFIILGICWHFGLNKIPFGRLPGDIYFESKKSKIFIPITTSILISVVFSILAFIYKKFF